MESLLNRYTATFVVSTIVTVVLYALPVFYPGLELFLLPGILILFGILIIGIIAIPFAAFKIYKRRFISNKLKYVLVVSAGFCIGLILNMPVSNWDEGQRNLGGKIVSAEIEKYRLANGDYPEDLSHLDQAQLNQSLPTNYKIERFSYYQTEDGYDLDIHIPIMDRWHWNQEVQKFEYHDF